MQAAFRQVGVADQLRREHLASWPNVELSFAPRGILPSDVSRLASLQRPSHWLVSILILSVSFFSSSHLIIYTFDL